MKEKSRQLSYILRHHPESIGAVLNKDGYIETSVILDKLDLSIEELESIVDNNDKKRFAFNVDKTLIRANQGHSVKVKIEYKTVIPPTVLYHGTPTKNIAIIMKQGLQKMSRHAVHLSKDIETAKKVGARRGDFVILQIDTKQMLKNGFKFVISENGVYLIDEVPAKYISML